MNSRNNRRWLALRVIDGDVTHRLSYVSVIDGEVEIVPFDVELPGTSFYSGTIRVVRMPVPRLVFE